MRASALPRIVCVETKGITLARGWARWCPALRTIGTGRHLLMLKLRLKALKAYCPHEDADHDERLKRASHRKRRPFATSE